MSDTSGPFAAQPYEGIATFAHPHQGMKRADYDALIR